MTWHLNGEPLPLDPGSGWPLIDGYQYPPSDPARLEAAGAVWITPEPPALTAEDICRQIDSERDRRIDGGFPYMGHRFQSRPSDRENIASLGADALDAIRDGAQPDDYFWHPAFPQGFGFITEANETVPMDAFQTKGLRAEGTGFKARLTLHARDKKDEVLAAADPSSVDWMTGWPGDV